MSRRAGPICAAFVTLLAIPSVAQAWGRDTVAEQRLITRCIHRSARGKPWMEKMLRGLMDQEGGWVGAEVRNRDGSYDLGPMQINSWWVPRFAQLVGRSPVHVQRWLRQDACFNVEAARYILLYELYRSGDIWTAVGRYHSPVWWRQRQYVVAVSAHLGFGFDSKERAKQSQAPVR